MLNIHAAASTVAFLWALVAEDMIFSLVESLLSLPLNLHKNQTLHRDVYNFLVCTKHNMDKTTLIIRFVVHKSQMATASETKAHNIKAIHVLCKFPCGTVYDSHR